MSKKKIILIGASGVLGKFFSKKLSENKNIKLICSADNILKNNFNGKNKKFNLDITNEVEIKNF
jgi:signal recognition particle receptor subunit beta